MKRLLDYDHFSGVATWHEYDAMSKTTTIARTQDVEPILEANKANLSSGGTTAGGKGVVELHLHARIPVLWREQFINKYGADIISPAVRKEFWRELEDPDNRYLKTTWKRHDGR